MSTRNQKMKEYISRRMKVDDLRVRVTDGLIEVVTYTKKRRFRRDEDKMEERVSKALGDRFHVRGVQFRLAPNSPNPYRFVSLVNVKKKRG